MLNGTGHKCTPELKIPRADGTEVVIQIHWFDGTPDQAKIIGAKTFNEADKYLRHALSVYDYSLRRDIQISENKSCSQEVLCTFEIGWLRFNSVITVIDDVKIICSKDDEPLINLMWYSAESDGSIAGRKLRELAPGRLGLTRTMPLRMALNIIGAEFFEDA
jgi:hypothetical protein